MAGPAWLLTQAAELPSDESWLSARERTVLDGLRVEKRRGDWLLGRWTAKRALAARLDLPLERLEVIAAEDGAPEAYVDGEPAPATLSISHRHGRALALVGAPEVALGCDLEVVEPRSDAFMREWLSQAERASAGGDPARANAVWCAKEAAAKARRGGLRLNVRRAEVSLGSGVSGWSPLAVQWAEDDAPVHGWWREPPGWVMAVVTEPPAGPPEPL